MKKRIGIICVLIFIGVSLFSQNRLSPEEREWIESEILNRENINARSRQFSPVPLQDSGASAEPQIRTDLTLKPLPNLFFLGAQLGIGFSAFQSELHGNELSFTAGLRVSMYFPQIRNIGFSFTAGYGQTGGNENFMGYYSRYNDRALIRYLNAQLTASFYIDKVYFGAGAYAGYKIDHTFGGNLIGKINRWDAGFVVEGGYIFDIGKNTALSVGVEVKIGAVNLFSYYYSQMKNISCNFNVGIYYTNLNGYQDTVRNNQKFRENDALITRKKIREQIAREIESGQFAAIEKNITVDSSYFTGPEYIFGGIRFTNEELKHIFEAAGLENEFYMNTVSADLSRSRTWLWSFFLMGPFCGIPSYINMRWANKGAEAFSQHANSLLLENTADSKRLYLELLVSHRMKKMEIQKEMLSTYSFFGIYVAGGGLDVNGEKSKWDRYSYNNPNTYTNFDIGFRFARLYSLGKNTYWKCGFIIDGFYELRYMAVKGTYGYYDNRENVGYLGGNFMLAFKNRKFYFGMGGNINYRLKKYTDRDFGYFTKRLEGALIMEPGLAFENKIKILFGLQIRIYLKKMYYLSGSSYYGYTEHSGIPYTIMGQCSIGF